MIFQKKKKDFVNTTFSKTNRIELKNLLINSLDSQSCVQFIRTNKNCVQCLTLKRIIGNKIPNRDQRDTFKEIHFSDDSVIMIQFQY